MSTASAKNTFSKEGAALIATVFIAGLCSIIYELLIGTTSSYFLGDSVRQFSLTIGIYMASMGLGSYVSRHISDKNLLEKFILIEIILGLLGGISVPALYLTFAFTDLYGYAMFALIIMIGLLIGLEIPFLTRIMQKYYTLKINLSNVLSMDYFGALIATLIFPFFLLPFVGTFKSSLVFGLVNMMIGFLILFIFSEDIGIKRKRILIGWNVVIFLFLLVLLTFSGYLLRIWTSNLYQDRIIFSKESQYQNIVMTKDRADIRLYLNGSLQFSSIDEYRYHESLIHPALSIASKHQILILGGGDGLAVRELLKYPEIEKIIVCDLDPEITHLALHNAHLKSINQDSLSDARVKVINQDAFIFLLQNRIRFDVIVADLPDPNNTSLSRLYSKEFYHLIRCNLNEAGIFVTQATSPFFAKNAFWCIADTIQAAGFHFIYPYHVNIPSFGEWGFVMASLQQQPNKFKIGVATRYLDDSTIARMFLFEKDLKMDNTGEEGVSTLDRPIILSHYLKGWQYWN